MHTSFLCWGFIITTESNVRIYHAGDTAIYSESRLIGQLYHPNIALYPIGRAFPSGHVDSTIFEIVLALSWLGPDIFVPMHFIDEERLKRLAVLLREAMPWLKIMSLNVGDSFEYTSYSISYPDKTFRS